MNLVEQLTGMSNSMSVVRTDNNIFFKSKLSQNFLISLIMFMVLLFAIEIIDSLFELRYVDNSVTVSLIISIVISLTYRKIIAFDRAQSKVSYCNKFLGFNICRDIACRDIKEIAINTKHVYLYNFPRKMHTLNIILNSGKKYRIDRSTDKTIIKNYADIISSVI